MNKTDEHKAKLGLLGGVDSGDNKKYEPKIGNLLRPLPRGADIWVFCGNCGAQFGIPAEVVREVEEAKHFSPISPKRYKEYFLFLKTGGCKAYCRSQEKEEIKFVKIADLARAV